MHTGVYAPMSVLTILYKSFMGFCDTGEVLMRLKHAYIYSRYKNKLKGGNSVEDQKVQKLYLYCTQYTYGDDKSYLC